MTMRGRRQDQQGGDSSVNMQAGGNILVGLSLTDARQVAMDTFRANFVAFQNDAMRSVLERADELVTAFLHQVRKEGLTEIPEGRNPDFQYALFNAQKEYARTGDEDLGELLVQLLIDRTKVQQRDLEQIVLNESLEVAAKLTPDQLDALSLIFCCRYMQSRAVTNLAALHTYLDTSVLPFVNGASQRESAFQHMEYAGCGTVAVTQVEGYRLFIHAYGGLFSEGFTEQELRSSVELTQGQVASLVRPCLHDESLLQVNALTDSVVDSECQRLGIDQNHAEKVKVLHDQKTMGPERVQEYLVRVRPMMAQFFELWDETPMRNFTLTSVGLAIAHANIKRTTGEDFPLSPWM